MRALDLRDAAGPYLEPDKTTLAAYLDRWLDHMRSLEVSPRTHERYCQIARKNVVPAMGGVILSKLRPAQISLAYANALTSGRRDGKGGLAPTTVIYMHRLIKHALAQAVRWEVIGKNPADAVDPPKAERGRMSTYDMEQTADLLEKSSRGSRLFIPVMLAVL